MKQERLYSRLFAAIYDPFLYSFEQHYLQERRRHLIKDLRGRVIEVGSGTGINFPLYREGVEVIAFEPSRAMMERARRRLEALPPRAEIRLLEGGIGDEDLEGRLFPHTADAVVSTLVLCTIADPDRALRLFRTWLKPGGTLVVLEHIRSHANLKAKAQDFFNPVWKHVAEGCHLNRPTDRMLKEAGFDLVEEEYFARYLPFYQAKFRLRE